MVSNPGVEANALNNGASIQAFQFGVGVEFVKIADAKCEIGVSKEFHRLGFGRAHIEYRHVFLQCAFFYQLSKEMRLFFETVVALFESDYYPARIKVILEGLALS